MRGCIEQVQLRVVGGFDGDFLAGFGGGGGGGEFDVRVVALQFCEDGFGAVDDGEGEAGEAGNLDAIAAVGGAGG